MLINIFIWSLLPGTIISRLTYRNPHYIPQPAQDLTVDTIITAAIYTTITTICIL